MDNVTKFPVVPRQRPQAKLIPIRAPSEQHDEYKLETMRLAREAYTFAVKKLLIVAEFHGESAWAIRLIEQTLIDAKSGSNGNG